MDTLFTKNKSRVVAIGAGTLGCLAARLGAEGGDEGAAAWGAAHVNSTELIATGLDRKIFLKGALGPFASRGLAASVEENLAALERMARGYEAAILCGELGDALAIRVMAALAPALREMGVPAFALAIEPFSPNGEIQLEELNARRVEFEECAPFAACLNSGLENVSAGVSAKRIEKMAAERLARAAECLAAGLSAEAENSEQMYGLRGLHRAIFSANGGAQGVVLGAKTSAAVSAFEAAFGHLDETARVSVDAIVLTSAAELSFREVSAVMRKIPVEASLVSAQNAMFAGRAECLVLSGKGRAGNVVGIEAGFSERRKCEVVFE